MPLFTAKQKIRIAGCLYRLVSKARALAGRPTQAVVTRRGIRWKLDLKEGIDFSIYLLGAFEPVTLRAYTRMLRPGAVIFDIGANVGAHTLHFAKLTGPDGQVHAFEPTDFAFNKLQQNLALNPELRPRVRPVQAFLVNRSGTPTPTAISSSWPIDQPANDQSNDHGGRPMTLGPAVSITADEYCRREGISHVDFVKIDVDGFEPTVLQGFEETLRRCRPVILMELAPFVYPSLEEFTNLLRFLRALDYHFYSEDGRRRLPDDPDQILALIPRGAVLNALLRPSSPAERL